jgi:transposase-like protein
MRAPGDNVTCPTCLGSRVSRIETHNLALPFEHYECWDCGRQWHTEKGTLKTTVCFGPHSLIRLGSG